jgi:hypothetical protein
MQDVLSALKDTPLPTILVIAGIFCLVLSVTSQFTGKITVDPTQRFWARVAGAALVVVGIGINYAGSSVSGHGSAEKTTTNELDKDRPMTSDQQTQASVNRGSYDGKWVADLPAQGNCPASHLVINVRGDTISGEVVNAGGTFPIDGRNDNGVGTLRVNNSDENNGTIRFSDRGFVADYKNASCGMRHAEGSKD